MIPFPEPDRPFPGQEIAKATGDRLCWVAMHEYLGGPVHLTDASFLEFTPSADTWKQGDREIVCFFLEDEARSESWRDAVAGTELVSTYFLPVGSCFANDDLFYEPVVTPLGDCDEPHVLEVFASFDLPQVLFPGDAETTRLAEQGCLKEIEVLGLTDVSWTVLRPWEESWALGDRRVFCLAETSPGTTGSVLP